MGLYFNIGYQSFKVGFIPSKCYQSLRRDLFHNKSYTISRPIWHCPCRFEAILHYIQDVVNAFYFNDTLYHVQAVVWSCTKSRPLVDLAPSSGHFRPFVRTFTLSKLLHGCVPCSSCCNALNYVQDAAKAWQVCWKVLYSYCLFSYSCRICQISLRPDILAKRPIKFAVKYGDHV